MTTKRNPKDNGVQLPFTEQTFIDKWQEWLLYRKERKLANYVPRGLKGTFTMLKNISANNPETAIAIIQQSMDNNYQGLFPLKTLNNVTTNIQPNSNGGKQNGGGTSTNRIETLKNW
jgi:hypothetical protein